MHTFWSDREPWCLATWVRLAGATEDSAMADKERRFGDAQFMRNLPLSVQVEIQREGR